MRSRGRVDANQAAIVKALRAAGRRVLVLSAVGKGCPDLLVSWPGHNLLMECKMQDGKLTPDQERFFNDWTGPVCVVRSAAEALAATGVR